jgi:hypothetical protein
MGKVRSKIDIGHLEQLRERLESMPDARITMASYATSNHCGTAGCLAGHAVMLMSELETVRDLNHYVRGRCEAEFLEDGYVSVAAKWLRLRPREAEMLFYPSTKTGVPWPMLKKDVVLRVIDEILAVREIREGIWDRALRTTP